MSGRIDVHTSIRVEDYKQLVRIAEAHDVTIAALLQELIHRGLSPRKIGRPTKYSRELGERICEARWFHRSWEAIAQEEHIAEETAKKYAARFEAEQRAHHTNRSNAA